MPSIDPLDLVWGAKQIAPLINRTEREVFYMLATGQLKGAQKKCGRWCITGKALIANFDGSTLSSVSVDAALSSKFYALMRQLPPEDQSEVLQYWTQTLG